VHRSGASASPYSNAQPLSHLLLLPWCAPLHLCQACCSIQPADRLEPSPRAPPAGRWRPGPPPARAQRRRRPQASRPHGRPARGAPRGLGPRGAAPESGHVFGVSREWGCNQRSRVSACMPKKHPQRHAGASCLLAARAACTSRGAPGHALDRQRQVARRQRAGARRAGRARPVGELLAAEKVH
jgi:hypothetical protein